MAREHSRVAHGEVDLLERAVVAVDRLAVAEARRRGAHGLAAGGELGVEVAHQALDRACLLERLLGARRARRRPARFAVPSSARPRRPNTACAARLTGSFGSGENSSAIASATTPPIAPSRIRFGENAASPDGPVITSSIADTAASEITSSEPLKQHGDGHRQHDHDRQLGRAGADEVDDHVRDGEAGDDAEHELGRALAVLAVRGADRDHGGDAGEDRLLVGQQRDAQVPRGQRGDGGLQDRERPPVEAPAGGRDVHEHSHTCDISIGGMSRFLKWRSSTRTFTSSIRGSRSSPTRAICRSRSRSPTTAPAPRTWTSRAARSSPAPSRPTTRPTSLDALEQLGEGFVGVANVPPDITDREALALYAGGVRAYRVNLFRGGDLEQVERAERFAELCGWHLEVYLDGDDLPELAPRLAKVPRLVIDHLGMSNLAARPAPRRRRRVREGHGLRPRAPRRCRRGAARDRRRQPRRAAVRLGPPLDARRRAFQDEDLRLVRDVAGPRALFANAAAVYR